MKVQLFATNNDLLSLEEEINDFISDKKVIDMKYSVSCFYEPEEFDGLIKYESGVHYYNACLVMYED